MGLGNSGHKTFLNVADGKIIQKVTKDTPGAVSYEKEDKTVIYQLKHTYIEGFLTGISITSKEFNGKPVKQWNFDIEDETGNYQLQIKYSSGYATSLLKALLNPVVDFNLPIRITPGAKTVNDKKKTSMYLKQGEDYIKWYFTKDEPNGMPEMRQVEVRGEKIWDDYAMMQFIEAQVEAKIKPNLYKSSGVSKPSAGMQQSTSFDQPSGQSYSPSDLNHVEDPDSDLPF